MTTCLGNRNRAGLYNPSNRPGQAAPCRSPERDIQLLAELGYRRRAEPGSRLSAAEARSLTKRGVEAIVRVLARHGAAIASDGREAPELLADRQLERLTRL